MVEVFRTTFGVELLAIFLFCEAKLRRFKKKLKAREEQLIRDLDEVQENVHELEENVRKTVQAGKEKFHGL